MLPFGRGQHRATALCRGLFFAGEPVWSCPWALAQAGWVVRLTRCDGSQIVSLAGPPSTPAGKMGIVGEKQGTDSVARSPMARLCSSRRRMPGGCLRGSHAIERSPAHRSVKTRRRIQHPTREPLLVSPRRWFRRHAETFALSPRRAGRHSGYGGRGTHIAPLGAWLFHGRDCATPRDGATAS
jgi:hypothetical protein